MLYKAHIISYHSVVSAALKKTKILRGGGLHISSFIVIFSSPNRIHTMVPLPEIHNMWIDSYFIYDVKNCFFGQTVCAIVPPLIAKYI